MVKVIHNIIVLPVMKVIVIINEMIVVFVEKVMQILIQIGTQIILKVVGRVEQGVQIQIIVESLALKHVVVELYLQVNVKQMDQ